MLKHRVNKHRSSLVSTSVVDGNSWITRRLYWDYITSDVIISSTKTGLISSSYVQIRCELIQPRNLSDCSLLGIKHQQCENPNVSDGQTYVVFVVYLHTD